MYSVTQNNDYQLDGIIGWSNYVSGGNLNRAEDRGNLLFNGTLRGLTGAPYQLTHHAACRVLKNAGRNQEQIDETLAERNFYVFELNAASQIGLPYLVGDMSSGLLTVTAAVYNLSYFTHHQQSFNFYFEADKETRVLGKLGQFENYAGAPVEHPLRLKYRDRIEPQEAEWQEAQQNEDNTRTGSRERLECRVIRVSIGTALKETYREILTPYLIDKFNDQ